MFRLQTRNLATAEGSLKKAAAASQKILPLWAAKQIPQKGALDKKLLGLRKKEIRLKKMITRDVNNLKQHNFKQTEFSVDPVLGDELVQFLQRMRDEIAEPSNLAYGYKREELEKLLYGAQKAALDSSIGGTIVTDQVCEAEEKKRRALLTILNMKNTNAADKKKLAISFARKEFERFDGDTGSPEVQAAIMTVKIHFGFNHIRESPKDHSHIQVVRELVQHRQRVLKYLKKDNPQQYFYTIAKLGLADDVVTSEFSMGRQYFQDYKVWGEKQLVKLSEKQQKKEQKFADLQKKVNNYNKLAKQNYAALNQ
ncbi:hypothetical protein METBIDRAFT_10543 [Metschnikowia bicuspidata var. bicuspidata NRRL YB-4993]|uniref:Ribosomal protein S15 n=1 Tax=Metschnikowia bicuspidata var. bicuspidata NRRL YB-4993 TaxID=869754 RepID=A0A1A0HK49_9ASCO|nr:hypothetical protein METBIDRAFT_10543 [Metschnikowia bicuspidata var. bicuspidata NRRL YB-4993]OBA24400.1 hypothetical protein METBIDRAFT_10543 [Metschnikowia bicuspidata var. bicuspidata NRRL YB-4993]